MDTHTAQPPGLLSFDEAAAYLRMGRSTLARMVARGEIASFKIGSSRKFLAADLDAYIAARRQAAS